MAFVVVYDANVLYPATLRDVLIRVAQDGLVQAKWTNQILDETFESIVKQHAGLDPAKMARTRDLMSGAIRDCLVTGYEPLINVVTLPDPDDPPRPCRHQSACASDRHEQHQRLPGSCIGAVERRGENTRRVPARSVPPEWPGPLRRDPACRGQLEEPARNSERCPGQARTNWPGGDRRTTAALEESGLAMSSPEGA
jgi:hypothetical protein